MSDCIFCDIVSEKAPCHRIYEDDDVIVFLDIFPLSPGHTLVIPRQHATDLFEMSEGAVEAVARITRRVAHAIRRALDPDGVMVAQLNGAAAGQTVFHYHLHLIPRAQGDPVTLHTRVPGEPAELAATATRLTEALEQAPAPAATRSRP